VLIAWLRRLLNRQRIATLHHENSTQRSLELGDKKVIIQGTKYKKRKEPCASGTHGEVFEGRHAKTNQKVAIKHSHLSPINSEENLKNEIKILKELDHPNIVKTYHGHYSVRLEQAILIMEYAQMDLFTLWAKHKFNESQCLKIASDIAAALMYLHMQNIIHRDVKIENILVMGERFVLTDFGYAIKLAENQRFIKGAKGTEFYIAPEIWGEYDCSVDIWALGIALLVCAKRKIYKPNAENIEEIVNNAVTNAATYLRAYPRLREIVQSSLQRDPQKRITAEKIYQEAEKHVRLPTIASHF
jgi:serine/threonine protein kinase